MNSKKRIKPGTVRITPEDNRLMTMPPFVNEQTSLPQWFKQLKKFSGSLRSCAGVNDYLTTGITIPLWTNVYFRPNLETNFWESRIDNMSPPLHNIAVQGFSYDQTGKCPATDVRKFETMQYPKIINPWRIETAPGWSSLILPPLWEPNENYDVLAAVVHTDFYHAANVVLNIKTTTDFTIKYGTPIMHVIPFKRQDNVSVIEFEDESNFKYVESTGFGFGHILPSTGSAGPYRRYKNKIDKEK